MVFFTTSNMNVYLYLYTYTLPLFHLLIILFSIILPIYSVFLICQPILDVTLILVILLITVLLQLNKFHLHVILLFSQIVNFKQYISISSSNFTSIKKNKGNIIVDLKGVSIKMKTSCWTYLVTIYCLKEYYRLIMVGKFMTTLNMLNQIILRLY